MGPEANQRDNDEPLASNSVMEFAEDIATARAVVRAERSRGRRIGLVPTMGALHAGHLALIEESRRRSDFVVVSVFVNPTQFGPNEDVGSYPRDLESDAEICRQADVGLIFSPDASEVYSQQHVTSIHVARLTEHLCGVDRPGHFDGVALVVTKLFNIVQPDAAYFGRKDAQQLAVIRQLTRDLNLPVEIVACPIVREYDGLAMSSRNAYLTPDQRIQARALHAGLEEAARRVQDGQRDIDELIDCVKQVIQKSGPCEIDYVSIVDPDTMQPVGEITGPALIALAVRIGRARLIDNELVEPPTRA